MKIYIIEYREMDIDCSRSWVPYADNSADPSVTFYFKTRADAQKRIDDFVSTGEKKSDLRIKEVV